MSSCFSRCLRVPIAIRAFYESYLWILQTLLLTHPDLHPGLLGVPLLRGRSFSEQDGTTSPRTAIINATMSRRFWPDEDPLSKRFKFRYQTAADPWTTVVGVVGDMHRDGVTRDPASEILLPLSQHPARGMDLVV